MNTTSNISAMQNSGAVNASQSQPQGQSSQGLLGFLDAILQQLNATSQSSGPPPSAQSSPQGLATLTEKIAALLKKDGISASALQNMSPQDLATKISALMQQQNITLPPALQNLTPQDLAALIQQNGAASNNPSIKPTLTSDLIAPQSADIQAGQTKDEIAKKISDLLEQQQGTGAGLNPAVLQQLKDQIAQLQSAPGTISQSTLDQLKTDLGNFLTGQGVSQATIASFLTDLSQSLQKNQTSATAATDTTAGTAASATTGTTASTATGTTAGTAASAAAGATATIQPPTQINAVAPQITDASSSSPAKGILSQDDKTPALGGKAEAEGDIPAQQVSAAATQQQPQASAPLQNLTAKIAGMSVNPALINDLANNNSGSGNGFSSQDDNTQQPDPTGMAALLQPLSADTLNNQNFTNYLTAAPGQPSATTQMVNIQMQRNIAAGMNTMTLQLEPADLGKMDVKLSFAKDGSVKAHMTVDKPETLALLQKDSPHLQRALQQSGIDMDENSLSFDLRQQSQQQNMNGYNGSNAHADEFSAHMGNSTVANALQAQLAIQSNGYITSSGVNIMV